MGLIAKDKGNGNYDPIPEGMHHAICYAVYELGTQFIEAFGKRVHQVLITWELPGSRIEIEKDGETLDLPRAISKKYTLSLHEKATLRGDLEKWRGKRFTSDELKGFDILRLLGANCTIQVLHSVKNDKTYANVSAIFPLMNGEKKEAENPLKSFTFSDNSCDIPEGVPEWVVNIIHDSEEWKTMDDVPTGENEPPWDNDAPSIDDDDLDRIPF